MIGCGGHEGKLKANNIDFSARICGGHWPYCDVLRWAWRKACWRHGGMRGTFARGPLRPPTRKIQIRIGWNESNERTKKAAEVFAFADVNQRKIKLRSHYLHWCQWCDCSGACKHWLMIHLHSSYSFLGGPLRKVTNRSLPGGLSKCCIFVWYVPILRGILAQQNKCCIWGTRWLGGTSKRGAFGWFW